MTTYISAIVEGDLDAAVVRRLAAEVGIGVGDVHVKNGKANVRSRIGSYNRASRHAAFVVLVDLDREYACAPELIADWLPDRDPHLCFRVAVRAIEAWLLADRERAAKFLKVRLSSVPNQPDRIENPKEALVNLARSSSSEDLRHDIVPRPGSGRAVGVAYSSRLIRFVGSPTGWRPAIAAESSESLARAIESLASLQSASQ